MGRCWYCDDEIEFRYVDGKLVPIHLSGAWCQGSSSSGNTEKNESASFTNVCRRTNCPECGEEIYFIRHNGGSVWVDELGWPWPKHACMDNKSKMPAWYNYFEKLEIYEADKKYFTGVVEEAVWKKGNPSKIIIAVNGGEQGRVILSTEGTNSSRYFKGKIVIIDFKNKILAMSTHDTKKIFKVGIDPNVLDYPQDWPTIK